MLLSTSIAKRIFRNYEKAAKANDREAMFNIGACYSTGYGVSKDENMAVEWCVKAAKVGSLEALFYLAENCEIGRIPVPAEMAFTWYHDAAKAGHLGAIWKVVCCYFCGYGTEKNAVECGNWKDLYNHQKDIDLTSEVWMHINETLLHQCGKPDLLPCFPDTL
jgi:TPR repeat protein